MNKLLRPLRIIGIVVRTVVELVNAVILIVLTVPVLVVAACSASSPNRTVSVVGNRRKPGLGEQEGQMLTERWLIDRANERLKELSKSSRPTLAEAIEKYEIGTFLSRGPDPDRACYWEREARIARFKILEFLPQEERQRYGVQQSQV